MTDIMKRVYGTTGLTVSALGYGAGAVGDAKMADADAARLLNEVLDAGVTLVDTARAYGESEDRIGRHLAHRRAEFVLSTKVGYSIPGYEDWTGPCVEAGVDAALGLLRTDVIDVVHLHSCPLEVLERGEVVDALDRARVAGKIRVAAYSGENAEIAWAVDSGRFGGVQTSVNVFDQRGIDGPIARAKALGLGVIAKRPVANAPWRFAERPVGDYCEIYWERMQAMGIDPSPRAWQEVALRFTAFQPGVSTCIVGTGSIEHLRANAAIVADGPLPADVEGAIRDAFRENDRDWTGQI